MSDTNTPTTPTVHQGADGQWYYRLPDPFIDRQAVGKIRPEWVEEAIAKAMKEQQQKSQPTAWQDAVVAGITEALGALKDGDPIGVQVWLSHAMAAARLQELASIRSNP